jgi:MFS family permease
VLVGFLIGGAVLQWAGSRNAALPAFAGIFLTAGLFRLVSLGLITAQREPASLAANAQSLPIGRVWGKIRTAGSGPLLLYLVTVQGAVQFSGPYFAPFMFEKLELSYARYVALVAASFVAKVVMLPAFGGIAHRVGAMRLLWLGGVGIVPLAGLWVVSDNFLWLLFVQVLAGAAWAAYELAFFLLFFESIPEDQRTAVLTFYNLANTTAWVLGAALGGLLLHSFGAARVGYLLLFGLSSLGRALALVLLFRVPATSVRASAIGVRTVGVRPMAASIDSPILPSLPDQAPDAVENAACTP